jgi:hypothetical protein
MAKSDKERRRKRREIRALQREATWLQKMLFALNKADEARDRRTELAGEEPPESTSIEVAGQAVSFDDLQDAIQLRVDTLMASVREMRRVHG